ncbi:MAG TPA: hydrogenase small subunit [Sideroxyarcus sp.]|nr:hydrogenase small subunit [Sideroxyarcus sp.]
MNTQVTMLDSLQDQGISRRTFLKFCAITASSLCLTGTAAKAFAQALAAALRPSVIWMAVQHCTGCSESLMRSGNPLTNRLTVENLILNFISLDYHETLQVAAGVQAEEAKKAAMQANFGKYVLMLDGSVPTGEHEWNMTLAGRSALIQLREAVEGAALVISVGNCASFGGLPAAKPNPSNAMGINELMEAGLIPTRPLMSLPGCPPVPEVIAGSVAYFLVNGALPPLDDLKRPLLYYGKTVHDCCPRLDHFNAGEFATSFDDDGARQGHCLLLLGCKGPDTFNACNTNKWNQGTSSPTQAGHGCIGCSEPHFWDKPGGIYGMVTDFRQGDGSACEVPAHAQLPVV